ncbi:MAG: TldD/PmbA family protein [Bacteroidales bacterium]|nr:TldD/PmbA family protein [Bacteroidales bacterium]
MEDSIRLVQDAIGYALEAGARKVRVTLNRSVENLVATLNGEIDKVTHCEDRSLSFAIFADGRYGSFSTDKLDTRSLKTFLEKAVGIVKMMAPDECRNLPSPERCCTSATTGNELDLTDATFEDISPEMRRRIALDAAIFGKVGEEGFKLISEEGEYSDSRYQTVIMDSQGLKCLHTEDNFDYGVEVTIEADGDKYSGWWWNSSSRLLGLNAAECGREAVRRAASQIGSSPIKSVRTNMVIDSDVASKVVSPILNALNAYSIQQNNSFLNDSLGKAIFGEGLTIIDLPHIPGQTCSKLFDSEGVATYEAPIIEKGVVRQYFVNSYMSAKLGIAPTVEDATRPKVMPWPEKGLTRQDILARCSEGILVTEFNGGNSNSSTGDFSYGVEGFEFRNGRIVRPVSGMLVTGNFITLWNRLIAAGDDARPCMSKLIPTLAFADVDFSG